MESNQHCQRSLTLGQKSSSATAWQVSAVYVFSNELLVTKFFFGISLYVNGFVSSAKMVHWIPYRLLPSVRNVLNKVTVRNYHQFASRNVLLTVARTRHSKSIRIPFCTGVEQGNLKEYLYLRDLDRDESLFVDLDAGTPTDKEIESLHSRLYPSIHPDDDCILESLVHASTIEEVFELTRGQLPNEKYASQAIATLWNLQKVYCNWTNLDPVNAVENNNNFIKVHLYLKKSPY